MSTMGMTRKTMRLFRVGDVISQLLKLKIPQNPVDALNYLGKVCLALYFLFDQLSWSAKMGLLSLTPEISANVRLT